MTMRSNYLQLQKLYNEIPNDTSATSAQIDRYNDLLAESENHTEADDRIARFLTHGLSSRHLTFFEHLSALGWLFLRLIVTCSLYALPLVVGIYAWVTN